jgi:hypothetical protein
VRQVPVAPSIGPRVAVGRCDRRLGNAKRAGATSYAVMAARSTTARPAGGET